MQDAGVHHSNVDSSEIEKFNRLAQDWWDPLGAFATLHQINPLRLGYIQQFVDLKDLRGLDVGCGGGILCEGLASAGASVTGIDLGPDSLQVAHEHAQRQNLDIRYFQTEVEHLAASEPASYDLICCMEMLEHVPDPESIIHACAQLVKPSGHLFFSTLNRNPRAFIEAIVGAEYLLGLIPKGTHEFSQFIRPSELCQWARAAKIQLDHFAGLRFNPLSRRYTLGKNISVNYLCHARPTSP